VPFGCADPVVNRGVAVFFDTAAVRAAAAGLGLSGLLGSSMTLRNSNSTSKAGPTVTK
jgi:hypothetical protein